MREEFGDGCFTTTSPKEAAAGAEGIVFCTPVETFESLARELVDCARDAKWITDVGSVKGGLVLRLEQLLGPRFVGAHPMAGSEKTGFAHSSATLFRGAVCILTPTRSTEALAQEEVAQFWRALGCKIIVRDPFVHDAEVARVSHLPHVTAAALANIASTDALQVAGPGFRDSTRIALGDPALWAGILLENREAVLEAIRELHGALTEFSSALQTNDRPALEALLAHAAARRKQTFPPCPAVDNSLPPA